MIVGFTGTRSGMSDNQRALLRETLRSLGATCLHHGDCIGADAEAHAIAKEMGLKVVIHPPTLERRRAFCVGDEAMPPRPYLLRNLHIVDAVQVLIAGPSTNNEGTRSGTWYTVRAARRAGKPITILPR